MKHFKPWSGVLLYCCQDSVVSIATNYSPERPGLFSPKLSKTSPSAHWASYPIAGRLLWVLSREQTDRDLQLLTHFRLVPSLGMSATVHLHPFPPVPYVAMVWTGTILLSAVTSNAPRLSKWSLSFGISTKSFKCKVFLKLYFNFALCVPVHNMSLSGPIKCLVDTFHWPTGTIVVFCRMNSFLAVFAAVRTAVFLLIQVFWDVTSCLVVTRHLEGL